MSFRHKLALFLVVTLAAVQALTALAAYSYLRASLMDRAKRDLVAASHNVIRQLDILSERASSEVRILSLDYGLRQAVAQMDYGTELSALRNHGKRVGAARMMLVGLDGSITADTGSAATSGRSFPYPETLADAAQSGERTALASLDGKVFWIVVVPIRAPVPIAFVAACMPVDRTLLEKLHGLSTVPRSLALAVRDGAGRWLIASRTANGPAAIPLADGWIAQSGTARVVESGGEYLAVAAPLATAANSAPVVAVMSYPLSEAFAAYRSVVVPALVVLGLALLAAVAGAFFVVRRASRPLEALAATARRIAKGDYSPPPRLTQRDELGQLSEAISMMTSSIAQREAALNAAIESLETARREAVSANEAKSQFLANMSHELRTPLNAIVGFGEMLQHEVLGPLGSPRYVEYARDICASGQHLLAQVARMLDLGDVEAGRLTIVKRALDVSEVLAHSVAATGSLAKKAGVEVRFTPAATDWQLHGDPGKLQEVFRSILHNAVKFTPAGGEVTVTAEAARGELTIRISDTGVGMRPEDIPLVTHPFHRLRHALDGQHQGAGLGLPYACAITKLHGGSLAIASEPGLGTTVEIILPLGADVEGVAA